MSQGFCFLSCAGGAGGEHPRSFLPGTFSTLDADTDQPRLQPVVGTVAPYHPEVTRARPLLLLLLCFPCSPFASLLLSHIPFITLPLSLS